MRDCSKQDKHKLQQSKWTNDKIHQNQITKMAKYIQNKTFYCSRGNWWWRQWLSVDQLKQQNCKIAQFWFWILIKRGGTMAHWHAGTLVLYWWKVRVRVFLLSKVKIYHFHLPIKTYTIARWYDGTVRPDEHNEYICNDQGHDDPRSGWLMITILTITTMILLLAMIMTEIE